jgi:hypothetical protein
MSDLEIKFSEMDPVDDIVGTEDVPMVQYDGDPPVGANVRGTLTKILTWILAKANAFTNQQTVTPARGSMSGAVSIDLADLASSTGVTWSGTPVSSNNLFLTITGNVTSLALLHPADGAVYNFMLIQGTGGNFTVASWPSAFDWGGTGAPTLSTAAGKRDVVSAIYGATETVYRAAFNKGS